MYHAHMGWFKHVGTWVGSNLVAQEKSSKTHSHGRDHAHFATAHSHAILALRARLQMSGTVLEEFPVQRLPAALGDACAATACTAGRCLSASSLDQFASGLLEEPLDDAFPEAHHCVILRAAISKFFSFDSLSSSHAVQDMHRPRGLQDPSLKCLTWV